MRLDAAAVPPSTARKALVMATVILLASKGTTVPLRLMTRNCPGAVAAMAPLTVDDRGRGVIASAEVPPWLVSVCMCCSEVPAVWLYWVTAWQSIYTRSIAAMQRDSVPVAVVGREIPASAANMLNFFVSFFSRYTQHIGVYASLKYKIMRLQVQCKGISLGLICG